jgi:hypothetical protein
VTIGDPSRSGYGNLSSVCSICQSNDWWIGIGVNIHVCTDISMLSSYQVARGSTVMMGNGSHATVLSVGSVDLKFSSGKIM